MQPDALIGGRQRGARRDVAAGVEAVVCEVVSAHAAAGGRDAAPVLRAGVLRVREDKDAPRDRLLLGGTEAGDAPAAACLPPGAGLALDHHWHGVTELRVGMAAAAAEPGGRRGGAGGAGAGVRAKGPR